MTAEPPAAPRRLRAPSEHGEALIEPPRHEVFPRLVAWNRVRVSRLATQSGHSDYSESLFESARFDLFNAAREFTRQYRDVPSQDLFRPALPIILSGHQPDLFHPGVWFKNFLLSSLATQHDAVGINLIIDNDVLDNPAIRVPTGTRQSPRVEAVVFDAGEAGIPYEERRVLDRELFDSFALRATELMRPWIEGPIVSQLWRYARQAHEETQNLGLVLARGRHRLEGEWGLQTLEVPLSTICSQPAFRSFLWPLLSDAIRFRRVYNAALRDYRTLNRIRSQAHPVPELEQDADWVEAPLWIWSAVEPRRRRLFVRPKTAGLELTDRASWLATLPAKRDDATSAWESLELRGIKIRPRALMTTMYARLILSDLFIHGIGGAKYDELTDTIIRSYFGIEPPSFLTATATVQLPLDYPRVNAEDLRDAEHEARQLRFSAERYLHDGRGEELAAQKQQLLREMPPRGAKKSWHEAMTRVNAALLPLVADEQRRLNERAAQLAEQHRVSRLLGSREFSFCLYPADFLRDLLLDLSRAKP